jgi:putative hemolysin
MKPPVSLPEPVLRTLQRAVRSSQWQRVYDEARSRRGTEFCEALLGSLNVECRVSSADLARIPATGPVVIVSNHPTGLLDGIALGAELPRIRKDIRFLANAVLESVPELVPISFFVDPFGGPAAARRNVAAMKAALEWLMEGGALITFPAGEVAHFDIKQGGVAEPVWNANIVRLAQRAKATVAPVFCTGTNSPFFHMAGIVHPRLRTMLLPHELMNKQHRTVEIRIGTPVAAAKLEGLEPREAASYLRRRTLLLAHRAERCDQSFRQKEVVPETPQQLVESDLSSLRPESLMVDSGEYQAWLAHASEIPNILREIARLRELTFRATGEGTGASIDRDAFDERYLHLFLWHPSSRKIAGAYRVGQTDVILPAKGRRGLYVDTLFRIHDRFFHRLGPALELGRSFVCVEHQKSYAALLSLWKGIARFVAENPRYRYLFGPVSISNRYLPVSRQLMVEFFNRHRKAHDLAAMVKPRSPFWTWNPNARDFTSLAAGDAEEISALLADIENDKKGVPVLLRHYLKLGGELLGFNLDRKFSNVLDGLILVDMLGMETKLLERYMGKDRAAAYLRFHRQVEAA